MGKYARCKAASFRFILSFLMFLCHATIIIIQAQPWISIYLFIYLCFCWFIWIDMQMYSRCVKQSLLIALYAIS